MGHTDRHYQHRLDRGLPRHLAALVGALNGPAEPLCRAIWASRITEVPNASMAAKSASSGPAIPGTCGGMARERADTAHRQARAVRVEAILSSLPVEPYNVGIARVHARLTVAAMAKGRPRSANDMTIAATAAATSRILLTTDASAGFDQLTGVRTEVLKLP